jgi:membrane protease YdiL (CAAX protease family)
LTVLYWAGLVGLTGLVVLGLAMLAGFNPAALQAKSPRPGGPPVSPFLPGGLAALGRCFVLMLPGAALGGLAFLPAVRRWAARWLPIDPASFVHATALAAVVSLSGMLFVPVAVLGQPPLLLLLKNFKDNPAITQGLSQESNLRGELYSLFWMVPGAVVAVGYPLTRSLWEALRRLGLVVPRPWQVPVALALTAFMVALMAVVEPGTEWLWLHLGWPTTDEQEFMKLLAFAKGWVGAAVIGVVAGVSEEVAVRGVLQPRLGILLSNLLFTGLHALQYNFDALVIVFLIGLILGVIRRYTNTTTTAIIHGTYDFIELAPWPAW